MGHTLKSSLPLFRYTNDAFRYTDDTFRNTNDAFRYTDDTFRYTDDAFRFQAVMCVKDVRLRPLFTSFITDESESALQLLCGCVMQRAVARQQQS